MDFDSVWGMTVLFCVQKNQPTLTTCLSLQEVGTTSKRRQSKCQHVYFLQAKCYIGSPNKIIYFWGKLTHPSFFNVEWQGKLLLFLKWKVFYLSSTSGILLSGLLQQFVSTNQGCMNRDITTHNCPNPWSSIDGNHKHFQILIALEWTQHTSWNNKIIMIICNGLTKLSSLGFL